MEWKALTDIMVRFEDSAAFREVVWVLIRSQLSVRGHIWELLETV